MIKLQTNADKNEVCVKDISFPASKIDALRKQPRIVTHRSVYNCRSIQLGDFVYCQEIDDNYCFKVVTRKVISKIGDSPYFKYLTAQQTAHLRKLDRIVVLVLEKTKYERPYKMSVIKARYPQKIYEKLRHNKVHAWRARTGIELIHKEPSPAEQNRIWNNWKLMSPTMKATSDRMSVQIFGMTNTEHVRIVATLNT